MTITTDGIVTAASALVIISAALGLIVRFVLLPYLREHLVVPVAEVREQVKNSHESNLREDVDLGNQKADDLADKVDDLIRVVDRWRGQDAQRWREHLAYSEQINARVERVETALRGDIDQN